MLVDTKGLGLPDLDVLHQRVFIEVIGELLAASCKFSVHRNTPDTLSLPLGSRTPALRKKLLLPEHLSGFGLPSATVVT